MSSLFEIFENFEEEFESIKKIADKQKAEKEELEALRKENAELKAKNPPSLSQCRRVDEQLKAENAKLKEQLKKACSDNKSFINNCRTIVEDNSHLKAINDSLNKKIDELRAENKELSEIIEKIKSIF